MLAQSLQLQENRRAQAAEQQRMQQLRGQANPPVPPELSEQQRRQVREGQAQQQRQAQQQGKNHKKCAIM